MFRQLARARTLSYIRALRAFGPLPRRRGRMPRQRQPDLIRAEYNKALQPFARVATSAFSADDRRRIVALLEEERAKADGYRADVIQRGGQTEAGLIIERAAHHAASKFDPTELRALARKFGHRTDEFQREQLDRQIQSALTVSLKTINSPAIGKLEKFADENVKLIKSVHERYFDRIKGDVREAFASGMRPETLAELWKGRDEMAGRDVMRIARDQIGKLNASFNEERQQAMGITAYIWRGAMDERERDEHVEREGERFTWDDPPEDGHPGEAVICRCFAEPDINGLLDDL